MFNDIAVDEIIVGIISLASVVAGTMVQKARGVVPKGQSERPVRSAADMGIEDLRDALHGLSQENRRLRARVEALEGRR